MLTELKNDIANKEWKPSWIHSSSITHRHPINKLNKFCYLLVRSGKRWIKQISLLLKPNLGFWRLWRQTPNTGKRVLTTLSAASPGINRKCYISFDANNPCLAATNSLQIVAWKWPPNPDYIIIAVDNINNRIYEPAGREAGEHLDMIHIELLLLTSSYLIRGHQLFILL